jgi:hypothetical protein
LTPCSAAVNAAGSIALVAFLVALEGKEKDSPPATCLGLHEIFLRFPERLPMTSDRLSEG